MLKVTDGSLWRSAKRMFKQMNAPYKLVVSNEETLQETITMHLTKKGLFVLLSSLFVGLFLLFSLLIFFTPLKYYVPGNNKGEIARKDLFRLQRLSDSLIRLNGLQENYIKNLLMVVNGEIASPPDTQRLSKAEIQAASTQNSNQIDKASRYEYLRNQKPDTNVDKSVHKKDSLTLSK